MINENVQKLKNTIRAGRAMHGYLVTSADCDETAPEGEPSSTAELLRQCAALLLFGSEKTEMLEFSPDFYELNGGAKVEQMRMIRQELSKKAFGGNNRVVVITDAHMMNDSAVNAMLKMLEEPPEGTFFLLTGIEQRILPTIRSRCQIVRLGTASAAEIGAELIRLGAAKSEAQRFAAQSMGSLTVRSGSCRTKLFKNSGRMRLMHCLIFLRESCRSGGQNQSAGTGRLQKKAWGSCLLHVMMF